MYEPGDYVDAVTWTILEVAIAMICACLPAIRNLLARLYPQAFLTTMRSSSNAKTKPSSSRGWRSGSRNAMPDGHFVELEDGAETDREALDDASPENGGKNSSLSAIEVIDEILVESSPRRQEPASNV
jgi:hypothetical protein